jgi:hypothetical protein
MEEMRLVTHSACGSFVLRHATSRAGDLPMLTKRLDRRIFANLTDFLIRHDVLKFDAPPGASSGSGA